MRTQDYALVVIFAAVIAFTLIYVTGLHDLFAHIAESLEVLR